VQHKSINCTLEWKTLIIYQIIGKNNDHKETFTLSETLKAENRKNRQLVLSRSSDSYFVVLVFLKETISQSGVISNYSDYKTAWKEQWYDIGACYSSLTFCKYFRCFTLQNVYMYSSNVYSTNVSALYLQCITLMTHLFTCLHRVVKFLDHELYDVNIWKNGVMRMRYGTSAVWHLSFWLIKASIKPRLLFSPCHRFFVKTSPSQNEFS